MEWCLKELSESEGLPWAKDVINDERMHFVHRCCSTNLLFLSLRITPKLISALYFRCKQFILIRISWKPRWYWDLLSHTVLSHPVLYYINSMTSITICLFSIHCWLCRTPANRSPFHCSGSRQIGIQIKFRSIVNQSALQPSAKKNIYATAIVFEFIHMHEHTIWQSLDNWLDFFFLHFISTESLDRGQ